MPTGVWVAWPWPRLPDREVTKPGGVTGRGMARSDAHLADGQSHPPGEMEEHHS